MNTNDIPITPPLHESLLFSGNGSFRERVFLVNPHLREEIKFRKELFALLKEVFGSLPTAEIEIKEAVYAGLVTAHQAEKLYRLLADFLKGGGINSRLVLYLPFELIPDRWWKTPSPTLDEAISGFHQAYLTAWKETLHDKDIRSCFTDGDIPENKSEPIPRVVKAAHLTWVLVKKGLLSMKEAASMIETCQDSLVKENLSESFKVIEDMILLYHEQEIIEAEPAVKTMSPQLIIQKFYSENAALKRRIDDSDESPKRKSWLLEKGREGIIRKYAEIASSNAVSGSMPMADFKRFIQDCSHHESSSLVAIDAIGLFLAKISAESKVLAFGAYSTLSSELGYLRTHGSEDVQTAMKRLENRLSRLGMTGEVDHCFPGERFSLQAAMNEEEAVQLMRIHRSIKEDEQLSKMLFPVILLYGSKVKGYGGSDFDLAIIVRPWVRMEMRDMIKKKLSEIAGSSSLQVSFLDFWLAWEEGFLRIRDVKDSEGLIGENSLVHVLFEAAWIGDSSDVERLILGLLVRLFSPATKEADQALKLFVLRELERNTLQFRLLHKGYRYLYPEQEGIKTRNSSAIDSESSFWDSGYRQLATKLFVSKVFL